LSRTLLFVIDFGFSTNYLLGSWESVDIAGINQVLHATQAEPG
jgi:hypothetical protein